MHYIQLVLTVVSFGHEVLTNSFAVFEPHKIFESQQLFFRMLYDAFHVPTYKIFAT